MVAVRVVEEGGDAALVERGEVAFGGAAGRAGAGTPTAERLDPVREAAQKIGGELIRFLQPPPETDTSRS